MHLYTTFAVLSSAFLAVAQNNPVILVGSVDTAPGGIFQFIPPTINATNGTTVTFRFTGAPGNHSVTQSSFTDPCNPLVGGFDSGWVFIPPGNVSVTPEWNLTITNSSRPLWFFCKQLIPQPHCATGMIGAINAATTGNLSFSAYQANAKAFQGNSGQGEGSLVGQGASASVGPGPIASGATAYTGLPATSGTAPPNSSGSAGTGGAGTGGALGFRVDILTIVLATIGLGASLVFI